MCGGGEREKGALCLCAGGDSERGVVCLCAGGESVREAERFPSEGGEDVMACLESGGATEVKVHQPGSPNRD